MNQTQETSQPTDVPMADSLAQQAPTLGDRSFNGLVYLQQSYFISLNAQSETSKRPPLRSNQTRFHQFLHHFGEMMGRGIQFSGHCNIRKTLVSISGHDSHRVNCKRSCLGNPH